MDLQVKDHVVNVIQKGLDIDMEKHQIPKQTMETIEPLVFQEKHHEFPMTDKALLTIKRVMDEQDQFGMKKYGKPLDWRDDYNWREMKIQELADFLKYEECERQREQEVIKLLRIALYTIVPENKDDLIVKALKLLTYSNTGK
jgi:hypothetical protein